jgi:hypothetical protein
MSSIFGHNLSATFRDRAYASFGRGGSFKVAAAFAVGVALTALVLKPVPEEARAAWAGGSPGVDVKAVQADVSARVAAHKHRRAVEVALAAKMPVAINSSATNSSTTNATADRDVGAPAQQAAVVAEPTASPRTNAVQTADAGPAVPMPAARPSAADIARTQAVNRAAAAERKRVARARDERREMHAENYPSPQAYRISDGRLVRLHRTDPRLPPSNRYASRATNPFTGLLGLFGVAD